MSRSGGPLGLFRNVRSKERGVVAFTLDSKGEHPTPIGAGISVVQPYAKRFMPILGYGDHLAALVNRTVYVRWRLERPGEMRLSRDMALGDL